MRRSAIALIATAALLAGCGTEEGPARSTQSAPEPWGMTFVATEITRGGKLVHLIGDTDLEVRFQEAIDRPGLSDTPQGIAWQAGCNYMGGRAGISGSRLMIGQVTTTEMGCPPTRRREDRWLSGFFSGDPTLRLEGDLLTLRDNAMVIRLTRRPR